MARIIETKEIDLNDLVIGKAQVRLREVGKDIDELAASIAKVGLLEPIVVCPANEEGKFEIITGQRRFLAHKLLKKEKIMACILDQEISETEAKVLSITENMVRSDLPRKDLIDACTDLYRKYGSIKDVVEETGLPYSKVTLYVKYDRLAPELKELVDEGDVDLKAALRAQDAASVTGEYKPEEATMFAKEFSGMSGAQQKRVVKKREEDPSTDVSEVIENAKTGEKITQVVVTMTAAVHGSLKQYSKDEATSVDDAAATLIEEALSGKGYTTGD